MKRYLIPAFIVILTIGLVAFCAYANVALAKAADSILANVEEIGRQMEDGQWTEALTLCGGLDQRWQKEQRVWAMLVDLSLIHICTTPRHRRRNKPIT